jgi:hypothetical protein
MKCPLCGKPVKDDVDGRFCSWCPWEEYVEDDYIDERYEPDWEYDPIIDIFTGEDDL